MSETTTHQVALTLVGPDHKVAVNKYSEDVLLLTATGEVKQVHQLQKGEVLIRFADTSYATESQRWTVMKIERARDR